MAPNIVQEEPKEVEVASNPTASSSMKKSEVATSLANKGKPAEGEEELSFFEKYKNQVIIAALVVIVLIVVISVTATLAGNDDDDEDRSIGGGGGAPTVSPSGGCASELDTDCDGLVEWGCSEEPYFDSLGRLIFTGCSSS